MKLTSFLAIPAVVALSGAVTLGQSFIIENRSGGQNYANFSFSGWATSSGNVNAPGCTLNIGSMYSSTSTYFGPSRYAQFSFTPTVSGTYQIDLAWTSTAGQIGTAVNLYTGAATGNATPDIWGNTGGPQGIIFSGTMDMYYKNAGVWNTFTTQDLVAGTTYNVGIYGGYKTPYAGGATPADASANRVAAGAVQFTLVPEPTLAAFGFLGGLSLLVALRRRE